MAQIIIWITCLSFSAALDESTIIIIIIIIIIVKSAGKSEARMKLATFCTLPPFDSLLSRCQMFVCVRCDDANLQTLPERAILRIISIIVFIRCT